jgi:hypothetical protein
VIAAPERVKTVQQSFQIAVKNQMDSAGDIPTENRAVGAASKLCRRPQRTSALIDLQADRSVREGELTDG